MHVRQVVVENFRGIRSLSWVVTADLVCLVGPGDSTKTTVLDAIEYALWPRQYLSLCESDFFGCSPEAHPLRVEVTVVDVPGELLTDTKFGLYMRGWSPTGELRDEPTEECEEAITVSLRADGDLDPRWTVITARHAEPKAISWRDRARLGLVRLGGAVDQHLAWGRGSALARLTEDSQSAGAVLAAAYRAARGVIREGTTKLGLEDVAQRVQAAAEEMGVHVKHGYGAGLDPVTGAVGLATVSLHDGEVPLRATGLGTRRLAALGIQRSCFPHGAIVLIDEVENGLEPHRLRNLIRQVRPSDEAKDKEGDNGDDGDKRRGQVLMTTHSPVAIERLEPAELHVVRSDAGETRVVSPDAALAKTLRACPEALLGRKLLVCEGQTEVGFCQALKRHWQESYGNVPPECIGLVLIDGGGDTAALARAKHLKALAFDVAFLGDSDKLPSEAVAEMKKAGIEAVVWEGEMGIEKRLWSDMPADSLPELLRIAADHRGERSVVDSVRERLALDKTVTTIDGLLRAISTDEAETRKKVGEVAGKGKWYKAVDVARRVGELVAGSLHNMSGKDVATKIATIGDWCYGG